MGLPAENSWEWIQYDRVKSLEANNGWGKLIDRGQLYQRDGYAFYTRTTQDQLCGIVFGLTIAQVVVDDASVRRKIAEIVNDLINRLRATNWSLEDQTGTTGTNAHKPDPPLRLALEALHHATSAPKLEGTSDRPSSRFFHHLILNTAYYNRSITRTFDWNLHAMTAHSLMLLRGHHLEAQGVERWEKTIWRFLASDDNPHFAAMHSAWSGAPISNVAWENLQRRATDDYYKFFSWEKDPEQWWHLPMPTEGPGL